MDGDHFQAQRPFIRGSLFGMAVCNALIPRARPNSSLDVFGTETSMTICAAQAAIDDGGYKHDKFTYIKKLSEWLKDDDLCGSQGDARRRIALVLNTWDRHQIMASAKIDTSLEKENWEIQKERFEGMQKLINNEFDVDLGHAVSIWDAFSFTRTRPQSQQDGATITCAVPISLYYIPEDRYDESLMRIWAMDLASVTHPNLTNRILSSLCCELVHSALAAGCSIVNKSSSKHNKLDKEWLARLFAELVQHFSDRPEDRGIGFNWWHFNPPNEQGKMTTRVLVDRLRPYKDINTWTAKAATDLKKTGSALDSFEAALWCFFTRPTFKEGAIESVSIGGDSAAIGAMYGALAGVYHGYGSIPEDWISQMGKPQILEDVVDGLEQLRTKHLQLYRGET
ncbi:MAG: hypothetical protein Q9227_001017 [Pyrenula ochraceoflavens]